MENLSDTELLTIIRAAENTNVSGSRYQKAKTEWEIRHKQATLQAMKSNNKPSFVHIAPGAKVKGLTMKGNTMVGKGDFLKNEGELEDATLNSNKHIIPTSLNKKQFDIWEKQRKSEYDAELEKMKEDFASRGLAYSGMRNKAEKDLKNKYSSEIEIVRLKVSGEKGHDIDWQKWGVITAIIIGIGGIIATIIF